MVRKERRLLSLFGVCVPNYKSQTIRPSPFPKNRWGNPAAGPGPAAQTQHRPLQARRCSFMSRLSSMNLRIFPNIGPAPYPLSGCNPSPVSLPSVSLVPLLRSQATPFPTCWTEPKKSLKLFLSYFGAVPAFSPSVFIESIVTMSQPVRHANWQRFYLFHHVGSVTCVQ